MTLGGWGKGKGMSGQGKGSKGEPGTDLESCRQATTLIPQQFCTLGLSNPSFPVY